MSQGHRPARHRAHKRSAGVSRGTCASCCEPAVMSAAPDQSPCLMMHTLCCWTAVRNLRPLTWPRLLARSCLLSLGLAGDLDDLRFHCSETVGPCAWWSSSATAERPWTAQLCRTRLTADACDAPRPNLSRRQSATMVGASTDHARVCLVVPPPASAALLVLSTRASHDGRPVTTMPESSTWEARVLWL